MLFIETISRPLREFHCLDLVHLNRREIVVLIQWFVRDQFQARHARCLEFEIEN